MGAGIDPKRKRRMIYGRLKTIQSRLERQGLPSEYSNLELNGRHFSIYFAGIGPASNGESFSYLVLRFNPTTKPSGAKKMPGDIDYTDFHTRDIPGREQGGFDAGVAAAKALLIPAGNIFWKHIKPEDTVVEREHCFVVNGTHVANWGSIDAGEAQQWLRRKAAADAHRTNAKASDSVKGVTDAPTATTA